MPYVSKHYTGEQIDQRLLKGYYDDFVLAGFTGTIQEFHTFVLSIKDKIDKGEAETLMDEIKTQLEESAAQDKEELTELIDELDQKLSQVDIDLEGKIPTKVSQLTNDSEYQTKTQVENYVSSLVDGADDALDTLKELAEALNNDPDFAANITKLITQVSTNLQAEVDRAKEAEAKLDSRDNTLSEALQGAVNHLNDRIDEFTEEVLGVKTDYQNFTTDFNQKITEVKSEIHTLSDETKASIGETKQELVDLIDGKTSDVSTDLNDKIEAVKTTLQTTKESLTQKITDETTRATTKEQELQDKITAHQVDTADKFTEMTNTHNSILSSISQEATLRKSGDDNLTAKLQEQSLKCASDKTELLTKITEEVTARTLGDNDLKGKVDTEVLERKEAVLEISNALHDEEIARANDIKDLTTIVSTNKTEANQMGVNLNTLIQNEITRAKEAEEGKVDKVEGYTLSKNDFTDALKAKLDSLPEAANHVTKVSELINDSEYQTKDQVSKLIDDLIGAAPDTLNTLKELADALGNDPNFATTLANRLSQLATQLNEEIEDRKEQKTLILEQVDTRVAVVNNDLVATKNKLDAYIEAYDTQADQLLDRIDGVDNEISDLENRVDEKVTTLETNVNTKTEELQDAFNTHKTSVERSIASQDNKIGANTEAIQNNLHMIQEITKTIDPSITATLRNDLDQEIQFRKNADDLLGARIDEVSVALQKEVTDRENANNTLDNKITAETTRATAKEDELLKHINDSYDNLQEVLMDEINILKSTVGSLQTTVQSLQTQIQELTTALGTKLDSANVLSNDQITTIINA